MDTKNPITQVPGNSKIRNALDQIDELVGDCYPALLDATGALTDDADDLHSRVELALAKLQVLGRIVRELHEGHAKIREAIDAHASPFFEAAPRVPGDRFVLNTAAVSPQPLFRDLVEFAVSNKNFELCFMVLSIAIDDRANLEHTRCVWSGVIDTLIKSLASSVDYWSSGAVIGHIVFVSRLMHETATHIESTLPVAEVRS